MSYALEQYQGSDSGFREMRELLGKSYQYLKWPANWLTTTLDGWKAHSDAGNRNQLAGNTWFWREKSSGQLTGFCVIQPDLQEAWLQLHPDHAELNKIALPWLLSHQINGRPVVRVHSSSKDQFRSGLLQQYGFQPSGNQKSLRVFDLSKREDLNKTYRVPLKSLAERNLISELQLTARASYGASLPGQWVKTMINAGNILPEHVMMLVSPEEEVISFCCVHFDEENLFAELNPIVTHPRFRGMGMTAELIDQVFLKLKLRGIRHVYVSDDAVESIDGSSLFSHHPPDQHWNDDLWVKTA